MHTVIFDLDDTLLWDEKSVRKALEETCAYGAAETGLDESELLAAVKQKAMEIYAEYSTYAFTKMIGINPFEGLWGDFDDPGADFQSMKDMAPEYRRRVWNESLTELGMKDEALGDVLAETFRLKRREHPYLFEDALFVLDALKAKAQLVMLTNGSPQLQNLKLDLTPDLTPYFAHIIISGAFGKGKPDPSIFYHALETSGAAAGRTLMVGDNLKTDIQGANAAGIQSVWLNRFEKPAVPEIEPTYQITSLKELLDIVPSP